MGNVGSSPVVSTRICQIPDGLAALNEHTERLAHRVSSLVARLEPVLHPPVPTGETKSNESKDFCPLAIEMARLDSNILASVLELENVLERLEL